MNALCLLESFAVASVKQNSISELKTRFHHNPVSSSLHDVSAIRAYHNGACVV